MRDDNAASGQALEEGPSPFGQHLVGFRRRPMRPEGPLVGIAAGDFLRLVAAEAEIYDLMRPPETNAERVKRLQLEAHALALEEIEALEKLLLEAAAKAKDIANGGDAYPVGAREMASRLAADLPTKAETIKTIVHRVG